MGKKIQCIGRYAMDGVTLGKGNFAHVELATHGVTEVKVAIKIIDTRKIKDEYVRTNLHREARLMTSLRHPNIIRLYETLKATTLYCLVTEYASGGDLLAYIKTQKDCRLGESASRPFIRQLVSAIDYLHERHIVHRDLKMENIMLDEKMKNIKLIDFGLSNIYKEEDPLKTHCGSPEYAAPELFVVGKTYGPEIDIWSLGIIMYAMILGRLPFCTAFRDEYHRQRMLQQIQKGLSPMHDREMQVLSADCRSLLHQLIEPNPELRIPLGEIYNHQWLTKNGKCPFFTYVPPPRNKSLRNEIVSELATLMDLKKGIVNETVKDHRADELSAMFNMMMDQKKRHLGMTDMDHTKKAWQDRNARSRSVERDKSVTPESSRTKPPLVTRKVPTGKKSGVGSKAKPKNRTAPVKPAGIVTGDPAQPTTVTFASDRPTSDRATRLGVEAEGSTSAARAVTPTIAAGGVPSRDHRRSAHPANPTGAPNDPNIRPLAIPATDTSKIPRSQLRVPPPKLSLTLDLSVTNPGTSLLKHRKEELPVTNTTDRKEPVADCSFGIAASSGVPPRLSPKDGNNRLPTASGGSQPPNSTTSATGKPSSSTHHTKTVTISTVVGVPKARRPSSLQYCLKTSTGRLSVPRHSFAAGGGRKQSTAAIEAITVHNPSAATRHPSQKDDLVAPKATPEDSLIDSCSTEESADRDRYLGTLAEVIESTGADSMQLDLLNALGDSNDSLYQRNVELCRDEVVQLQMLASTTLSLTSGANPRPIDYCEPRKMANGGGTVTAAAANHGLNGGGAVTAAANHGSVATHQQTPLRIGLTTACSKFTDSPFHGIANKLLRQQEGGSGVSLPASFYSGRDSINKSSAVSLLPGSQPSETDTLLASDRSSSISSKITKLSLTLSLSGGGAGSDEREACMAGSSSGKLAAPKPANAFGLSPGSPSYDDRHAKFSHIGSHALDVFFSPEEISPMGMLWRPVATTLQASPTRAVPSSGRTDRFDGDPIPNDSLLQPPSDKKLAPLITSLDIFSDMDDDEDDEEERNGGGSSKARIFSPLVSSSGCDDLVGPSCRAAGGGSETDCGEAVLSDTSLRVFSDQLPSNSPSSVNLQHASTSSAMMTTTTIVATAAAAAVSKRTSSTSRSDADAACKNSGASWLKLPETCQHKDNHSPSSGTVWPAVIPPCSRSKAPLQCRLSSASSSISQDSLEESKINGSTEHLGTGSLIARSKGGSVRLSTSIASDETKNAVPQVDSSRIPRPSSFRRRIPVLSSFLNRDRRSSVDLKSDTVPPSSKKEDKRIVVGSCSSGSSAVDAKPIKSSWRHGLSHWLQMSRSTSSTTNSNNNIIRSNQKSNNVQSSALAGGGVGTNSKSAPMSISLISNHGCKSSLTISNNIISKMQTRSAITASSTGDPGGQILLEDDLEGAITAAMPSNQCKFSSKNRGLLGGVVGSLVSVHSHSPLVRLRNRKIQWQQCQKCNQTGHSSDESADVTIPPLEAKRTSTESLPEDDSPPQMLPRNNITQSWTS